MKFDLHCHTKEGSFDSKIAITEYIDTYRGLGFGGFMITDHNSYKGCRFWDRLKATDERYRMNDFTVLTGIEYDTKDAGHVLVIMPDGVYLKVFEVRGMSFKRLAHMVHRMGGVLGLAHPFGIPASSAMSFKRWRDSNFKYMDFIEVFNTCEKPLSNKLAKELADKHGLPGTSGTDAHDPQFMGMAATEINQEIRCNNDLILAIRHNAIGNAVGTERGETLKGKAKDMWFSQVGYRIYNRGIGKSRYLRRRAHYKIINRGHKPFKFKGTE